MTQTTRRFPLSLTSFDLRLLAMLTMLADHVAKTLVLDSNLTAALGYLGRLAFPIFAFQIVEGYFHTHSFKQYCKRLLVFALLSEIPYNLIMGLSSPINPFHQNVLWTFLIGLLVIRGLDRIRERFPQPLLQVRGSLALVFVGYGIGNLAMVDYSGPGVLLVVTFYLAKRFAHGRLIQLAGMVLVNGFLLQNFLVSIPLGSQTISFSLQALAILSLIPIWLYNGQRGYSSKAWSRFCYWFYPVHMLVLIALCAILY